jgi:hypothetical protein
MTMVKSSENAGPVPQELLDALEKQTDEAIKAGMLLDTAGLAPSATGARVRLSGGKVTVTDGPFTEAKELVGGYAVIQARSKEEAVEAATQMIRLHKDLWPGWEGEIEVREVLAPEGLPPQA